MMLKDDPAIETIREARHCISQEYGHDPQKLVNYYIELQKQYQLIDTTKQQQSESVEASSKVEKI
ncbi:hypothetical protein G7B40_012800 [Aetokthonos hydrillicola Thurmond2011]|jgi:hypothetical protein|uniref:Uncharacterized protein n=1 Tax=Aetokthonos hydrillicola Thurmond2011 TaxID=2712845 RepID=A0AAP5IAE6_9CYAN|nr:hypothetical protein [Aetokthonos hydrillicola]MBO3459500.1 hypothetical protein [Aetokthonos hydrillicola CCALA 1050]MBW4583863.1 hypothetical protein [Aetokthonos hydrillicola CCALA 1050]MDR9895440.1 hypothetical protein [Aetokthonos hydrillicola Thurmond2011]